MKLHFFRKKISSTKDHEKNERRVEQYIDQFKNHPTGWNEEKMGSMSEIKQAILGRLNESVTKQQKLRVTYRKIFATAASIALICGAAWLGIQYREMLLDTFYPSSTVVVKTEKNQIKKINLQDGSVVWLNGNSSISYPERFNHLKREVVLMEGEAFFDIHHDDHKPFQVKAGATLTNVLGTSFNISSYQWRKTINVTVVSGKVAVNNQVLFPNDQLTYHKSSSRLEKKTLHGNQISSWIKGKLIFNDEDFGTVASILENKFNVTISFGQPSLAHQRFTATFEQDDQLEDILELLALTGDFHYKIDKTKIIINH